jgi:hypothetical protein|tara:strand:+ start:13247 stop:13396 length:150 start_codon:yes stop_codon:yes gene_type:complete
VEGHIVVDIVLSYGKYIPFLIERKRERETKREKRPPTTPKDDGRRYSIT